MMRISIAIICVVVLIVLLSDFHDALLFITTGRNQ